MYLFLDTHLADSFVLGVFDGKKWKYLSKPAKFKQGELVLPAIQKFVSLNKLQGIAVVSGPGSFSGLRLGIMVANTVAWVKKIPVVGAQLGEGEEFAIWCARVYKKIIKTKAGKLVAPEYGKEPNITIKKKSA